MRASLADQGGPGGPERLSLLAIGLGANLPSAAGDPCDTLVAVRPRLDALLCRWAGATCALWWSPLFRTAPVGGPPGQPDYLNAALVAAVPLPPDADRALTLLRGLQRLELAFGRERLVRWGARSLDLDLLWWNGLTCEQPVLQLPHPRWRERGFVVQPLRAIAACCARQAGPGAELVAELPVAPLDRFRRMLAALPSFPELLPLPPQNGWPE